MLKPGKMASEAIKPFSAASSYFSFRHSFVTFRPAILRLPQWRRPQGSTSTIAAKRSPKRLKYSSQCLYKLEKATGGMTWGHPNVKNDADLEEGTGGMTCGHPNVKSDADLQNLEPDPYLPGYLYGFDTAEKWQQLQQMPSISAQSAWRAEQYHKEFPLQFEDRLQLESIYCDLQHFQGKNTELQQNGIRSCNIQEAQCRHRGGEQHWPRGRQ
ncbi:uncharacterized protein LOC110036298 [Phalaenopsis equestris]|uniref:uncharacterized protein LOC110036298 n=1 Tax=Phalaenopsis equestris TaxID=78828 RepID=UPI0009E36BE7|nr:uncharacterized protein LOC110036298 [Phalaenopsis equestris]